MSKILNQETRMAAQQRRLLEQELDALRESSIDPSEFQALEKELHEAHAEIDLLKEHNQELLLALDEQPDIVYRQKPAGIIEAVTGVTVFLIAICVIGVASMTINSQSLLIDSLMSQVHSLRLSQDYNPIILSPRLPQSETQSASLELLETQHNSKNPSAISLWDDPSDPMSGPYSMVVQPRTRTEAMRLALSLADQP